MSVDIRTPKRRECVRCGRVEEWDDERGNWVVSGDQLGNVRCIHTWDITGEFTPIRE